MLNRKDYRKYWVKQPPYEDVCKGCDLDVGCCLAAVEHKTKEFACMLKDERGYAVKYAVFKLIKKEVK